MATGGQTRKKPLKDRRAPQGAKIKQGSLSKLGSLLNRPLSVQRQGGMLRVVPIERRRENTADRLPPLDQLRLELRARLMVQPHEQVARVMRHLVFVHDELGRKGWRGVEAMPSVVLGKALLQAEMLASEEPSPGLKAIIDQLRILRVAAELREERRPRKQSVERETHPEVSDSTHEEFEAVERHWSSTLSPKLPVPDSGK
jgi:hypothetical protein